MHHGCRHAGNPRAHGHSGCDATPYCGGASANAHPSSANRGTHTGAADTNSDARCDAYRHPDGHPDGDPDPDSDADAHTHTDTDADRYADAKS